MTIPTEKNSNDAFAYLLSSSEQDAELMRTAVLSDFQVGLPEKPSELQLTGRISYSTAFAEVQPNQIVYFPPDSTIFLVSLLPLEILKTGVAYSQTEKLKQTVTVILPQEPRTGQVCYVKDASGTAGTCTLKIQGSKIDDGDSKLLDYKGGCIGFVWSGAAWSTLSDGNQFLSSNNKVLSKTIQDAIESYGPATTDPSYIVLASSPSLPNERVLTAGTNITITDNGPGSSLVISSAAGGGGSGDVVGPASSTTNAVAKYADTSGELLSNTSVTIDSSNNVTIPGDLAVNGGDITTTAATFNLVNAATTINLGTTSVTRTVNIGTGTSGVTSVPQTVNIGSQTATSTTTIHGGTGGIIIDSTSTTTADAVIGTAEVGQHPSAGAEFAMFGHSTLNHAALGNYALVQSSVGDTGLNAASAKYIYLRNNNNDLGVCGDGLMTFTGRVGVSTITLLGNDSYGSTTGLYGGTEGVYITGSFGTPYYIGGETSTGSINIGRSTQSQTINIGKQAANASSNTQTINVGHYVGTGGFKNVNVRGDNIIIGDTGGSVSIGLSGGSVTFPGDIAVNGGDITTTAGTFNLVNAATTINLGSTSVARTTNIATGAAAQTVTLGSATGASSTTINAGTGYIGLTGHTSINMTALVAYPEDAATDYPLLLKTVSGGTHRWAIGADAGSDLNFSYSLNNSNVTSKGYLRENVDVSFIDFTGQHRNYPVGGSVLDYADKVGLIVVSSGQYKSLTSGSVDISINEALPLVELSTRRNQKSAFGVVSDHEDPSENSREYVVGNWGSVYEKQEHDDRLIINSLGEGGIWICNINGNLENGDYITTCEIPGYGMKQDDDLLHNYTVAKITCDCDFTLDNGFYQCEEFQYEGVIYRRAFVGCTYHCG